ncbi:hypothetical protein H4S07_001557 [Coemansia furcata]|uniref:Uncharacterized protein n=1 Tax=Coemansia furcata TaxID=417177 RepID=A0ACC1LNC4_9FUNG|nr:hypothetical protein H4S07_001557 [Coemansia furcata]
MTARYPPCERGVPTKVLPKPKKHPSAETLYNQRHRTKLKISFPDKDSKDIAAMLANQWAKASDEERESFFEKERALQAQYNNKLAIYEAKLGEYMESAPVNESTSFVNESTSPVDEGRGYDKDSETGGDGGIDSISKAAKSKKKKKRGSSYDDVGLDLGLELDGSLKKRKKKKSKSKDR